MKFPITLGLLWSCVWPVLAVLAIGCLGVLMAIGIAEALL